MQEMFYNRTWGNVSIENFVEYLNTYLDKNSNGKKLILVFGLLQGLF